MKIANLVATAAIGSLLSVPVMASNDGMESNYEIQNTSRYEYSEGKVPEWAEQERERRTERNRFERYLADSDGDGFKLEVQNRYQNQERYQIGRDSGGFGGSGSAGAGSAGASSGPGKGSRGRN